jgi:hypothetical protein
MGGFSLTISLRKDEQEAIEKLMQLHGMKRHEIIKFALRRYLFPDEQVIPLNDRVAEPYPPYEGRMRIENKGITIHKSAEAYESQRKEMQIERAKFLLKKPVEERKSILKQISEKDRKELEDLGV